MDLLSIPAILDLDASAASSSSKTRTRRGRILGSSSATSRHLAWSCLERSFLERRRQANSYFSAVSQAANERASSAISSLVLASTSATLVSGLVRRALDYARRAPKLKPSLSLAATSSESTVTPSWMLLRACWRTRGSSRAGGVAKALIPPKSGIKGALVVQSPGEAERPVEEEWEAPAGVGLLKIGPSVEFSSESISTTLLS